jgi:hypothetical protein
VFNLHSFPASNANLTDPSSRGRFLAVILSCFGVEFFLMRKIRGGETEYLVFRVQSYSEEYPGAMVHNVYLATDSTPTLP